MEELLHYVWKHKIFPLKQLTTTDGKKIEIIDAGLANKNAGPDFFNAKIKVDEVEWIGNIEIHVTSSDWYAHGHNKDKAYDSVILHVTSKADCEVLTSSGRTIPQFILTCPDYIKKHYATLSQRDVLPSCYLILRDLSTFTVHSWFTTLAIERLSGKEKLIKQRLKLTNNSWEIAFFITLARNFGFGINGDAFERWASLVNYSALKKHRDNLFQLEAIFIGQAGLFTDNLFTDEYNDKLKKEFFFLQHKFDLKIMNPTAWRFLRLRPGNFPYVRLAQLANLFHREEFLFSKVIEANSLMEVRQLLKTSASEYWSTHYNFGKESSKRTKALGISSINLIIINTVIPFIYAYGTHLCSEYMHQKALDFLNQMKAENNYITRMWEGAGLPVQTASDSQALIQLKNEYCDKKKCLYCRFGYEYLKTDL